VCVCFHETLRKDFCSSKLFTAASFNTFYVRLYTKGFDRVECDFSSEPHFHVCRQYGGTAVKQSYGCSCCHLVCEAVCSSKRVPTFPMYLLLEDCTSTSEKSVCFYQTKRRHIPSTRNHHSRRHQNLRPQWQKRCARCIKWSHNGKTAPVFPYACIISKTDWLR
jgi:hypothetical protein